ncbi:hypothetical protein FRB90_010369 [Tulasnella sp. 427]|nr:hypothetical protein FRB90_010369 [Tulasnella sp. 427]
MGGSKPISFGKAGNYLWGNMPAFDALNVPFNEGAAIKNQDIALCFAASGDLRNVIKTINGLPADYSGKCTLVINDFHPLVAIRTVILLCILLGTAETSEEAAAEVALHALYSSKLTTAQDELILSWIERIKNTENSPSEILSVGKLHFSSACSVEWAYPPAVEELLRSTGKVSYSTNKAEADRRRIMIAPERLDYRERYYTCLRRRHRVGFAHQRETGILLPLGQPTDSFCVANRLLYSEDGEWLLKDNASPASAWAPLEVEAMRQTLDLPDEDYIGSLFFYIKAQLTEFARRARRFNLVVVLSAIDMQVLPELLDVMGMPDLRFDRVETSNVMDTLGPSSIISVWGPRLNRLNPHSALLMYSMNWPFQVWGGTAESQGRNEVSRMISDLGEYLDYMHLAMTSSSSLSSVVSNLVRAQLGVSISSKVTDEDLDKHVADLLLQEAKQKEEKYFGKEGVRAYYPEEPENKPRPNKRFLSAIIKTVDEHNAVIIEGQARAAASAKEVQEEEERKLRRARANEAAGDRLRRLIVTDARVALPTPRTLALQTIGAWTMITKHVAVTGQTMKIHDAVRKERERRGTSARIGTNPEGALPIITTPTGRDLEAETEVLLDRIVKDAGGHALGLPAVDTRTTTVQPGDGVGVGMMTDANGDDWMTKIVVRPLLLTMNVRDDGVRVQGQKSDDLATQTKAALRHPLAHSTLPPSRSHSPEPGPSAPIASKMDKYFDPAYDPMLDVDTPATHSVNELIPEGAFDHWNVMLELVKQRKEDKERKRREKEFAKEEKKKKKKRKHKDESDEEEEDERARRIRLGLEQPTALDVKYIKRGAMREWDVGKEVT